MNGEKVYHYHDEKLDDISVRANFATGCCFL